jgi:hypothetical protein
MNKEMSIKHFIIAIFLVSISQVLSAQTSVYFTGLGRAIVTNDRLKGPVLASTPEHAQDTTSPRKATGGYTLFDLGVNLQSGETLRGNAILRVRNEFGGFYGQGASLLFRQIRIEGVAAKRVKFQLGDIDLGLSPYTLYNPDEIYHTFEADIFKIRRNIVHYENFNYDNKWRVQGGDFNTHLIFTKGIEKIKFRVFGARTRKSNQFTNQPDRVFYGGRVEVLQSKFLSIGGNYIRTTDVLGTVPDTIVNFNDQVMTGDFKITLESDKVIFMAYGEAGRSNYSYFKKINDTTVKYNDYFYDLGLSAALKPVGLKFIASYRNVGANFFSPTAQTRRIFDYGTPTVFGTLQNVNDPITGHTRIPTLFDRYSQEGLYNQSISTTLMPFLPQYNNVTPYGSSTPNRKGFTFGIEKTDTSNIFRSEVKVDLLTEVVGVNSSDRRKFFAARGGFMFNVGKVLSFNRNLGINLGARYEHTTRANSSIDLSSFLFDAGLNFEVVKSLDLLFGYKLLRANGKEFLIQRDGFNSITNFPVIYDINQLQGVWATGLKYNFNNTTFFTAQAHIVNFDNNANNSINYNINQFFFNFTILF